MNRPANRIQADRTDHRYFVMLPQIVLARVRDPYDLALWVAVKSIAGDEGACSLGTRELARLAGMSVGKLVQSRQYLLDAGLLIGGIMRPPGYEQDVYVLQVPDLWPENAAWRGEQPAGLHERIDALDRERKTLKEQYAGVHEVNTSEEGGCSCGERGCSCGEHLERDRCSCGELIKEHNIEPQEEPLWGVTRERLRLQLPKTTFDTWLKDTTAVRADKHLIAVRCRSKPQAEFLKARLHRLITDELARLIGEEIAVTYIVQDESAGASVGAADDAVDGVTRSQSATAAADVPKVHTPSRQEESPGRPSRAAGGRAP